MRVALIANAGSLAQGQKGRRNDNVIGCALLQFVIETVQRVGIGVVAFWQGIGREMGDDSTGIEPILDASQIVRSLNHRH